MKATFPIYDDRKHHVADVEFYIDEPSMVIETVTVIGSTDETTHYEKSALQVFISLFGEERIIARAQEQAHPSEDPLAESKRRKEEQLEREA